MRSGWLTALVLVAPACLAAQTPPDSGAFVVMLGDDTIAIERYTRTSNQLLVKAVMRVPETRVLDLRVDWDVAGRMTGYELINAAPPRTGGAATVRTIARVRGDSLHIAVAQGSSLPRERTVTAAGDVPFIAYLYSPYEIAILRARPGRLPAITLQTTNGPVTFAARWSADSVWLTQAGQHTINVALDARGRIASLSGAETTFKAEVTPTALPDIAAIAGRWRPLGTLSPRDTAQIRIDGTNVTVDYGRPATRGRVIFGWVVPWDKVWRTGANAATQLQITGDIEIDGVPLPAGSYSLWTIPSRTQPWQLVINKQTGQWGTVYDEHQDFARIPIRTERLTSAVERFTIELQERDRGGIMTLSWERTRMIVPFVVK